MNKSLVRKGLLLGILVLFVVAGFSSGTFALNTNEKNEQHDREEYIELFQPPWNSWGHIHAIDGFGGWDLGWEEGTLEDFRIVTDLAAVAAGTYGGYQKAS